MDILWIHYHRSFDNLTSKWQKQPDLATSTFQLSYTFYSMNEHSLRISSRMISHMVLVSVSGVQNLMKTHFLFTINTSNVMLKGKPMFHGCLDFHAGVIHNIIFVQAVPFLATLAPWTIEADCTKKNSNVAERKCSRREQRKIEFDWMRGPSHLYYSSIEKSSE